MPSDTKNPASKEELQERAQLVRIHEANCQIEHPSETELRFRRATMLKIADTYNFKSVKGVDLVVAPDAGAKK